MDLVLIITLTVIVVILLGAAVLLGILKLFKVENASYKKSLIIVILDAIIVVLANALVALLKLGPAGSLLILLAEVGGFYFLLHYFLGVRFGRSIGILVVTSIIIFIAGFGIIIPFRKYLFEPFVVSSSSMEPNYNVGDYLFVKKYDNKYERGDVIVFLMPEQTNQYAIKRLVAVPGDKLEIINSVIYINGTEWKEDFDPKGKVLQDTSTVLGSGKYFILGDNREASADSRHWGPIDESSIKGEVYNNFGDMFKPLLY